MAAKTTEQPEQMKFCHDPKANVAAAEMWAVGEAIDSLLARLFRLNASMGHHHDEMGEDPPDCGYQNEIEEARWHLRRATLHLIFNPDSAFNAFTRDSEAVWDVAA